MKYLITIDLDDTLLTDNKVITSENIDVIKTLSDNGHRVVIATGRSYYGAVDYYNQLNLDTPLITDNGSLISHPTDKSFKEIRKTIPLDLFTDMFNYIKPYIASAMLNFNDKLYSYKHIPEVELIFNGINLDTVIETDLSKIDIEPMNLVVLVKEENIKEFEDYFQDSPLGARLWGIQEGMGFYDIHLKKISKASAIKELLNYYNISKDNLITFGDGVNDTEMLSLTKNGTAMLNAKDDIKKHAKNITKYDNNNSGVGRHLKDFFKI